MEDVASLLSRSLPINIVGSSGRRFLEDIASPLQQLLQGQVLLHPLHLEGRVGGVGLGVDEVGQLDDSHQAFCVSQHSLYNEGCTFRKVKVFHLQCLEDRLVAHDLEDIGSLNS